MIGKRIVLQYYDQNERMQEFLPRVGTIVRRDVSGDWGDNWFLVKLDQPFDYEGAQTVRAGTIQTLPGVFQVSHFLIRSRWVGEEIGPDAEVSVFVLVVKQPHPEGEIFEASDYPWGCWGTVKVLD